MESEIVVQVLDLHLERRKNELCLKKPGDDASNDLNVVKQTSTRPVLPEKIMGSGVVAPHKPA